MEWLSLDVMMNDCWIPSSMLPGCRLLLTVKVMVWRMAWWSRWDSRCQSKGLKDELKSTGRCWWWCPGLMQTPYDQIIWDYFVSILLLRFETKPFNEKKTFQTKPFYVLKRKTCHKNVFISIKEYRRWS